MEHTGGCIAGRTGERTVARFAWARSEVAASRLSRSCGFRQLASSSSSLEARSGPAPTGTAILPFGFAYFSVLIARTASAMRRVNSAASVAPSKTWRRGLAVAVGTESWPESAVAVTRKAKRFWKRPFLLGKFLHRLLPRACFSFCEGPVNFAASASLRRLISTHVICLAHSDTCFTGTAECRRYYTFNDAWLLNESASRRQKAVCPTPSATATALSGRLEALCTAGFRSLCSLSPRMCSFRRTLLWPCTIRRAA